jgi:putative FmdB family regulatory protein
MTYEYTCTNCFYEWEKDQKITENSIEECPKCGKKTAKRLISGGVGFQLKGSGWFNSGGY